MPTRIAPILILVLLLPSLAAPTRLSAANETCPGLPPGPGPTWWVQGHPELEAMAPTIAAILDSARVGFQGPREWVEGFAAGQAYRYPEGPIPFYIWARDSATIAPMARWLVSDRTLRSPIEEFLRLQYHTSTVSADRDLGVQVGAGALSGTISPTLGVEKATATSDEETSTILAAGQYFREHGGVDWLRTVVDGVALVERLNRAMDWLLSRRFDPLVDLIKRGHTTDWGDVKREHAPNPNDIGQWHVWTYSIYDQAMAFAALRDLAAMNLAAGRPGRAERYLSFAERLRKGSLVHLWMPDRGYYRIHAHENATEGSDHSFDEAAIVAIGNAAAVYHGLASAEQASAIVFALESARLRSGASKPGLTLEPPYPSGEFVHVQMAARNYQNGALWDWWAGRQITAEYRAGFARYGDAHLMQVATDWASHPGVVYEWESPWAGKTSDDSAYTGGAAVMGEAVVNGLFGVTLERKRLELAPRLGSRNAALMVTDASTGARVGYLHAYRADEARLEICFLAEGADEVTLRPLLPAGARVIQATLDGSPAAWELLTVGEDRYARVRSAAGTHRLDLWLESTGAEVPR